MKKDYEALRMEQLKGCEKKPDLLLHSCCAPCSTACLERLVDSLNVTVYYYNPNMNTAEEYARRVEEQRRLISEAYGDSVGLIVEDYVPSQFCNAIAGQEGSPEGGARCLKCFELRLLQTARYAKQHGYRFITTTLTVSPHKNAEIINGIGERVCAEVGVEWLYSDFKKCNGFLRSTLLSKQYGLYRQDFCGCSYSLKEAEQRRKVGL